MDSINLADIFTKEEQETIEKYNKKIYDYVQKYVEENKDSIPELDESIKTDESQLELPERNDLVHPNKISDAPVEITFQIKAIVTEVDEKNVPVKTIEAMDQYYHIPIVNGRKYQDYIDNFLTQIREKLETTCKAMEDE